MSDQTETPPTAASDGERAAGPRRHGILGTARAAVAGVLMGIANLIPGVSGGTMILAMGVYDEFIDSVADISALRFSVRRVVFLGIVGLCAAGAIVGLAGVILYLLLHFTVAMFALFIGLTLGGAPLLSRSLTPWRSDAVIATLAGLLLMVGVVLLRFMAGGGLPHNTGMDFVSGLVGSTTMVLPGISGSYMLLILDQYERIVGTVDELKDALRGRDWQLVREALWIVVPVGIGAVIGIVGLSNLLKYLLHHYRRATHGVLLGILLGSVIGLWPFGQKPGAKALERLDPPALRSFAEARGIPGISGVQVGAGNDEVEVLAEYVLDHWNQRKQSDYTVANASIAAILVASGFAATFALSRLKTDET